MSGKSERQAAREAVAAYHEARLAERIERVGEAPLTGFVPAN